MTTDTEVLDRLRVQILTAEPGDIVVLRSGSHMPPEVVESIKERMGDFLPAGVTCVVLAGGLSLDGVIRPEGVSA
jgi:hypothetical protein